MTSNEESPNGDYADYRKTHILNALQRLAQTMAYASITVRTICDEADISRPTFYHYFKDKDDIVQWYWDRMGDRFLKQTGRTLGWYESNLLMLKEFQSDAAFVACILSHSFDINACINHGYRRRVDYLREAILDFDPLALTDEVEFEIRFFADAESRAITSWTEKGMAQKPEQLARYLEGCVPPQLHGLIELALPHHTQTSNMGAPVASHMSS